MISRTRSRALVALPRATASSIESRAAESSPARPRKRTATAVATARGPAGAGTIARAAGGAAFAITGSSAGDDTAPLALSGRVTTRGTSGRAARRPGQRRRERDPLDPLGRRVLRR